jgi:hypothetical protein
MPRIQQHTFATMRDSLAPTKVGDTVYVSVDEGIQPTHYTVEKIAAPDTYYLRGVQTAKRTLVVAAAEQVVWLSRGTKGRRVVQAWLDVPRAATVDAAPKPIRVLQHEVLRHIEVAHASGHSVTVAPDDQIGCMRLTVSIAAAKSITDAETLRREAITETATEVIRALWRALDVDDDTHDPLVHMTKLRDRLNEFVTSKRELDKAHAALGRKLDAVEAQRDAISTALCQIRNAAHGVAPGTKPLPSNSSPANVAIDVIAALLRATAGARTRSPILVSPDVMYRGAIEKALPDRMHGESTNGDPR